MTDEILKLLETLRFTNVFWQLLTPLIFMLADYVIGFLGAVVRNDVNSKIMREGLVHKTILVIVILLSYCVDFAFNIHAISTTVCIYLVLMEVVSITENLKKAGINLGKLSEIVKIKK